MCIFTTEVKPELDSFLNLLEIDNVVSSIHIRGGHFMGNDE